MIRILLALFLALFCGTSFAQDVDTSFVNQDSRASSEAPSQAKAESPKSTPKRSSFYINGGIGLDYSHIYYSQHHYNQKIKYDGGGFGVVSEITMGFLIKGFIAVHGSFEYLSFGGKYDLSHNNETVKFFNDEIDDFAILGGAGVTMFPFTQSSTNFLQSVFFSAKFDLGLIFTSDPLSDDSERSLIHNNYFVFGMDLEAGKDWQISDRFFMGVGLRWQLLGIVSGEDSAGDPKAEQSHNNDHHLVNSIQLMLRFNRK
jgi:hypothetical protein